MSSTPRTKLLLVEDYVKEGAADTQPDVDGLRMQLLSLPGFDEVTLTPNGRSTVLASVPARNQRELDRLKTLVNERVDGWRVIEEQTYSLPKTF